MKNSILRKALAMGLAAMLVAGCGKQAGLRRRHRALRARRIRLRMQMEAERKVRERTIWTMNL